MILYGLCLSDTPYKVEEVGSFRLSRKPQKELVAGEVGYIIAGIKTVSDTRIGDTITLDENPTSAAAARIQGGQAYGLFLSLSHCI